MKQTGNVEMRAIGRLGGLQSVNLTLSYATALHIGGRGTKL